MIIAYLCGGLGNQMFQYAMARRLAQVRNAELRLDLSEYRSGADQRPRGLENFARPYRLNELSIHATPATEQEIARLKDPFTRRTVGGTIVRRIRKFKPGFLRPATHCQEKQFRFDATALLLPDNQYLQGFWQSEKYFADIAPIIREEFMPRDRKFLAYAKEYVDKLRPAARPIVSLHVRRGDLARADEELNDATIVYGKPVSLEYIRGAMARFGDNCEFLVFSDSPRDIQWCKRNISGNNVHYCENHSDIQDMAIMSACDHHIIANSTFSWWAAWLNDKPARRVIAPKTWANPTTHGYMVTDDLIPPGWERL
jgi:hypothetical protein